MAVSFCCTFLGVTSTRRYLASCPVKLGLSSPAAFRPLQLRLLILLLLLWDPTSACPLYSEAAASDKFPDQGIITNIIRRHVEEIIQQFL